MKRLFAPLVVLLVFIIAPVFATIAQDENEDIIELDFVHIFSDDLRPAVIQEIIDDYQAENPNVVINSYSTNANSDYEEVFRSALDNADLGEAPNIVQVEERLTQQAIDFGYFRSISELATEEQLASLDDMLPTVKSYFTVDGELWGLPWNVSNPILYYNKDAFESAGLDTENPPRTFEEVTAACEQLMANNDSLEACINWPLSAWYPEQWMSMQNALLLNNENGRAARATETFYDSEPMMNIARWWDNLDAQGYYSYTGRLGDDNGEGIAFLTGRTAMHINSTAGITLFQNFAQFDLGAGAMPIPDEDATNGVTVGGASVWVMEDQTEAEMEAAVDFIFYLTNTQNTIRWHQGTGYMPIRESAYEQLQEEGFYEENPFFQIAIDQLRNSADNPAAAGSVMGPAQLVRGHLVSAFQLLMDGEQDSEEAIQEALSNAKARADEELAEYNRDFQE